MKNTIIKIKRAQIDNYIMCYAIKLKRINQQDEEISISKITVEMISNKNGGSI
jgi:hypothetical protein